MERVECGLGFESSLTDLARLFFGLDFTGVKIRSCEKEISSGDNSECLSIIL